MIESLEKSETVQEAVHPVSQTRGVEMYPIGDSYHHE